MSLSKLRAGQVQDADWAAIIEASSNLSKLKIEFDDTPALSILELRAKARRELRDAEKGLIIVDYLQLMQPPQARRDGNRAVEVAEISRGLKVLAKEMDMPVIALSQLSRAVEMRGKKRPMLSDLRESGAIEQDADIVMFIDRSIKRGPSRPGHGRADRRQTPQRSHARYHARFQRGIHPLHGLHRRFARSRLYVTRATTGPG